MSVSAFQHCTFSCFFQPLNSNLYLITEESTPTLVAVALPGFFAGSMLTPRISNTLVAQWASPSITTSEKNDRKPILLVKIVRFAYPSTKFYINKDLIVNKLFKSTNRSEMSIV
jgi:hypothetical protein